jgi:hypothetical protein
MYRQETAPRRWPVVALVGVIVLVLLLAIAAGAARATSDAASTAHGLASRGQYGKAVAMYRAIAGRTGLIYVFDQSDAKAAEVNAERTTLAWAQALGQSGDADRAVVMARAVTNPALTAEARQAQSSLLLAAASAEAAHGDFQSALLRLQQLSQLGLSNIGAAAGKVPQLQIQYLVAESQSQLQHGNGVGAVSALDEAAGQGSAGAAAATPLLPQALLAAANQEIDAGSDAEAAATLQRLVSGYGASSQARQARTLLAQGQPVTGTLVDRAGNPLSAQVRLSSHFFSEPGGYLTSGPFFYANSDSDGNFRFTNIPVGGPYVFEIFRGGNWLTFVDPSTGQPANPVSVTPVTPVDLAFITVS